MMVFLFWLVDLSFFLLLYGLLTTFKKDETPDDFVVAVIVIATFAALIKHGIYSSFARWKAVWDKIKQTLTDEGGYELIYVHSNDAGAEHHGLRLTKPYDEDTFDKVLGEATYEEEMKEKSSNGHISSVKATMLGPIYKSDKKR